MPLSSPFPFPFPFSIPHLLHLFHLILLLAPIPTTPTTPPIIHFATPSHFTHTTRTSNLTLTAFLLFPPSTPHTPSHTLHTQLTLASTSLSILIPILTINCTSHAPFCAAHDIASYPALRFYTTPTSFTRYRGARKAGSIIKAIQLALHPPLTHLDTRQAALEFRTASPIVFVAYLGGADATAHLRRYFGDEARARNDEFAFGMVGDGRVAEELGVRVPSVVCYRDDGEVVRLEGQWDRGTLREWVEGVGTYVIGDVTRGSVGEIVKAGLPIVYVFTVNEVQTRDLRRLLTPLAKEYRRRVTFGVVDAMEYAQMAANLGLRPDMYPAVAWHNIERDDVVVYEQDKEIVVDDVKRMIEEVVTLKGVKDGVWYPEGVEEEIEEEHLEEEENEEHETEIEEKDEL